MKEQNINRIIHEKYTKKLKNLSVPHKKLMICFSGFSVLEKRILRRFWSRDTKGLELGVITLELL